MSHSAAQALESSGGATRQGPAAETSAPIGTTLDGSYRITRLIAEGGMSAVYEAVQLRLNQRVAVKVMARDLAANPEALARFRREAEITSRLRHPHLVTVMDFGTAPAGQPYLVMEYLEGIDLDHRIRERGRLPVSTVVHITRQAASALAAAHDQGIVHRDLKPANVFLVALPGEADFAKILDFGVSKVRAASTQLTKARSVIGTPNYMSPEQATGMLDEVDHRTDQWALACIAWEMLSGRPVFASDDISAVFYQVIHLDPKPLGKRAPDVPAAVEAVLRRALSKSIEARFPSVIDFADALAGAACEQATGAATRSTPDPAGRASGAGVERRQRRERRRATDLESAGASQPEAMSTRVGRRVKAGHVVALLTATMAFVAVISLRGKRAAAVAVPRAAVPAIVVPQAPGALSAAPRTPAPPPPWEAKPAPVASAPKPPEPMLRTGTQRPAPEALARAPSDPFAPTGMAKHAPPRVRRHAGPADDFVDPFAPSRPAGKAARPRSPRADADFVDPFAP